MLITNCSLGKCWEHLLTQEPHKLLGGRGDKSADDIQMKFGLDKCVVAHFVNGKLSGHNSG